jgi:hypothetical protein
MFSMHKGFLLILVHRAAWEVNFGGDWFEERAEEVA